MDGEVWHLVEARRDDGAPTIFRIRELDPRPELSRIFVVEMPYPITEMSRLPNATGYRRLAQFEEQWVAPACAATGYTQVGLKIEEGSFFLYLYGANEPTDLVARLSPFDAALGFYDDADPTWGEYATLRDLLEEAKAMLPAVAERAATEPAKAAAKPPRTKAATRTSKLKKTATRTGKLKKTATRTGKLKKTATNARAKKPATMKRAAKQPAANKPAANKRIARKRRT